MDRGVLGSADQSGWVEGCGHATEMGCETMSPQTAASGYATGERAGGARMGLFEAKDRIHRPCSEEEKAA